MRICALVPAFNEASHIATVVRGASRFVDLVVVIDDGSTDGTADLARSAGATCIQLPANSGKASALRAGIRYAAAGDFTHILTLDGDGQHRGEDIPVLLDMARQTRADLVIGTRSFDRDRMPRSRFYSNTVGSRFASALVGLRILDSQSGFRLIRLEKLLDLELRSRFYEFEMEVLVKMARQGCSIAQARISTIYENGQSRSKMKPIRDTMWICCWSLAFRFLKV
jgi:glycosyltransferase involved in cell wall biosynthesis